VWVCHVYVCCVIGSFARMGFGLRRAGVFARSVTRPLRARRVSVMVLPREGYRGLCASVMSAS
jgi:hypothetical protein